MSLADKRNETAKKIILEVQSGMIQAFNVAYDTSLHEQDSSMLERMTDDYDQLLYQLKVRFQHCKTFAEKRQLLTLAPSSWSHKKHRNILDVLSNWLVTRKN